MRRVLLMTLAALLAAVSAAPATAAPPAGGPGLPAVSAFLQDRMQRHAIPGMAVAVMDGDGIAYADGFGDAGGGRPVTADTPMEIGSMTKTVTAVAVLQLVERGAVALDAPVRTYLPRVRGARPDGVGRDHRAAPAQPHERVVGGGVRGYGQLAGRHVRRGGGEKPARGAADRATGHPVPVLQPRLHHPRPRGGAGVGPALPGLRPRARVLFAPLGISRRWE